MPKIPRFREQMTYDPDPPMRRKPSNPDASVMERVPHLPAGTLTQRETGPSNDVWEVWRWYAAPDGSLYYSERGYNGVITYWRCKQTT